MIGGVDPVVAGAFALAGGALSLIGDWRDLGPDDDEATRPVRWLRRRGRAVTVVFLGLNCLAIGILGDAAVSQARGLLQQYGPLHALAAIVIGFGLGGPLARHSLYRDWSVWGGTA